MLEFYLLYAAACALALGLRYRDSRREAAIRLAFAAAFPVIGFLFPLFRRMAPEDGDLREAKLESLLNASAPEEPGRLAELREPEREVNIVPLEEALLIGDLASRRRTMIELLNGDATRNLETIKLAVSNEDTETSHYAVSALVEIKRKLNRSLQELSVQYEFSRQDPVFLKNYAGVLHDYIRSGFLDDDTMQRLRFDLAGVLQLRIEADPGSFDAYEEKVAAELELHNYAAAETAARIFAERFPGREEPYLLLLNLYYSMRAPALFQETLLSLKRSDTRLTSRGLKSVRFWSEGA
ncbi:hypothetical protein QWJ34_17595 [Saccharibacillus sp. CPCC 101409]|uniref:hypothetical protein n=1 Tax=Saccharibacillus sp. CPCC 101409 TaxID=3058041 RepID=UPI002673EE1A|nr:hypothetical protein [Saccharibacillus sp. CPCC 101409]MDO3411582.1 hypothetical protein [Saccharibacillus sp. CPCC 101409]